MKKLFAEKLGKIVIVEGAGPIRTQIAESLRILGFNDIVGVPEVRDALGVLESEQVSWVISNLSAEKAENGYQLAKLIVDNAPLKNTKISLTLEESENYILSDAFSLGLLSWHKKPLTKDSITNELSLLIERAHTCGYNSTLLSATYLREHLKQTGAYEELLNFERELIKMYPANLQLFLHLVEPTIKVAGAQQAKSIMQMVKMVSPSLCAQVEKVMEQFLPGQKLDDAEAISGAGFNFLGLNRVMVVDSDETIHVQLKKLLGSIGIKEIECFSSGVAAITHLKSKPNPDLIIQEWKLPHLSGPAFLQQLRNGLAPAAPVIVLSSLLKKDDLPFAREMSIAATMEKPIARDELIRTLAFIVQQERLPTDQLVMERKMRSLLAQHKNTEAEVIKEKYLADTKIPVGAKGLIEAEFAFHVNNFTEARLKAIEAIKHAGDSIFSLNLLGKILLRLGEPELALRCFEKAQSIAPLNIDRICSIAEIQAEIGQSSDAKKSLQKAQELDGEGERVMQTTATVALQSGDIKTARKIMNQIPAIERVIAVMNNSAVALINSSQFDEGIKKYQATMEAVPDNRNDLRALILYNLALAYARDGRLEDTIRSLDLALAQNCKKIVAKASALKKKVTGVMTMGGTLTFISSDTGIRGIDDPGEERIADSENSNNAALDSTTAKDVKALLTLQRGDVGCYMVYSPAHPEARAIKLLENMPKFVVRQEAAH